MFATVVVLAVVVGARVTGTFGVWTTSGIVPPPKPGMFPEGCAAIRNGSEGIEACAAAAIAADPAVECVIGALTWGSDRLPD